jgi:hypothetical protein
MSFLLVLLFSVAVQQYGSETIPLNTKQNYLKSIKPAIFTVAGAVGLGL